MVFVFDKLPSPTSQVCRASMPVLTFARYILELSLMEYDLNVETSESMLATAVMYIALKVKKQIAYMQGCIISSITCMYRI